MLYGRQLILSIKNSIRKLAYKEGIEQGISQGISQGLQQAKIETAKNMLKEGLSVEQISRCTSLTMEIIDKLKK